MTARPVVDAHSHFTPHAVIGRLLRSPGTFPNIALRDLGDQKYSFAFPDTRPTRPIQPRLWDTGAGIEWLDRQGIDGHVTRAWADVSGYPLTADEAAAWCRLSNEGTLEELAGNERVLPLATVPLQSGQHAVQELEAAQRMGFRGLTIGTSAPGVELDHPDLDGL